jgi:hypothetical protein
MHVNRRKFIPTLVVIFLFVAVITNVFIFGQIVSFSRGDPGNVSDSYYNNTQLNVTVLQLHPRVLWYDLQNSTGASMLNAQLDVNEEYYFYVNVSSDQGWNDIAYVNITAWHDQGNDANVYNTTAGANLNLFLQYDGSWNLIWPTTGEVSLNAGGCSATDVTGSDPAHSPGNTETYNLTFAWTPGYQFRYAADPATAGEGYNDLWSWNVNITVDDLNGTHSYNNPTEGSDENEFGVYTYTEIITAQWPTITGNPGDTPAHNDSYIDIQTRSNGNYSLRVNVTNLTHTTLPANTIANTSILTAGGDLGPLNAFAGAHQYYFGGVGSYKNAENSGTSLTTSDIEWAVNIAMGTFPGDYQADIFYHLSTEAS